MKRNCLPFLGYMAVIGSAAGADIRPLVGTYSKLKVKHGGTIRHIARVADVNSSLLSSVNRVRGGRVKPGRTLVLPTLHILPRQPREGIVLNVPERNVYLFRNGQIKAVYPVALGSRSWQTPTGVFRLASKEVNPQWRPTKEMVAREDIKDEPVPPGKDNPVGDRWMGWSKKGYGFHSTKAPDSIGQAVSHGCVRLYPESAHKMFDLVRVGEPIMVMYEPILVGRREGRYFLSVFPDIYHQNLVSRSRAKAILQKEGLLSRVNMKEVERIVRLQAGYPTPLHLRATAPGRAGPAKPAKRANAKSASSKPLGAERVPASRIRATPSKPGQAAVKPGTERPAIPAPPPSVKPEVLAEVRRQWSLLLSRFQSGQVRLVNEARDLVQLEQLSAQGFLPGSDSRPILMDRRLGQALARLANHTTASKPLVLLSLYRARSTTRPMEPHANGLAADISAFAGYAIDNQRPSQALAGVLAVLDTLPPGRYRLGLPKPPDSDPKAFFPPPVRVRTWPFFPAPVPSVGQIGTVSLVLPQTAGGTLAIDGEGRFRPAVLRWANERSAPQSEVGDWRLRKRLLLSGSRGVKIVMAFPDAANHLHLDVLPERPGQRAARY